MKYKLFLCFVFLFVLSGCCNWPKEIVPCPTLPYLNATPPRPQFSVWMLNASTNTMTCIVFALGYSSWLIKYGEEVWEYESWKGEKAKAKKMSEYSWSSYNESIQMFDSNIDSKCTKLGALSFYRPHDTPLLGSMAVLDAVTFFTEHPRIHDLWVITSTDAHGVVINRDVGIVEKEWGFDGWHPVFNPAFYPVHILLENGSYYDFMKLGL